MTTPNTGITYSPVALLLALLFSSCTPVTQFDVVEATISDMQQAMEEGRLTSRDLVTAHLSRIARYEEEVNAAIAINGPFLEASTDDFDTLYAINVRSVMQVSQILAKAMIAAGGGGVRRATPLCPPSR